MTLNNKMLLSSVLIFSLLGAAAGWELEYSCDEKYISGFPFSGTPGRPFELMPFPVRVQFFLYSRRHLDKPQELVLTDPSSFSSFNFGPKKKTYFIIHGYTQNAWEPWIIEMMQKIIEREDANCIAVDWSGGSLALYAQAATNVRIIGRQVARLLDVLATVYNYPACNIHIIGHCLGAHIAGFAGKSHRHLYRITALDPAGPFFTREAEATRLCRTDAIFVDVIHTNGLPLLHGSLGTPDPLGDADFYPNGGQKMPECPDVSAIQKLGLCILSTIAGRLNCSDSFTALFASCKQLLEKASMTFAELKELYYQAYCSHFQAVFYYIDSINNREKYVAYPCTSLDNCQKGISEPCPEEGCPTMGHHAKPPSSPQPQKYTLTTM